MRYGCVGAVTAALAGTTDVIIPAVITADAKTHAIKMERESGRFMYST